jgi:hypothetical protein
MVDKAKDYTEDQGAVLQAIETFEGILEVFPEDVGALESLVIAYEQAGDGAKAYQYCMRLCELLSQHADWAKVHELAEHVLESKPDDEQATVFRDHAKDELAGQGISPAAGGAEVLGTADTAGTGRAKSASLQVDLSGELELAWFLLQNEMINQEQYERAIAGLTDSRMNPNSGATLSLLHELASMDRVSVDKIVGFLSAETAMPFIEVSRFDIQEDVSGLMQLTDIRRLGVLPFESFRDEVLVAVLNPVDERLRKLVSQYLSHRVHFYLTTPDQFQQTLDRLQKSKPE